MANSLITPFQFSRIVVFLAQASEKLAAAIYAETLSQWSVNDIGNVWIVTVYDNKKDVLWRRIFSPDEVFTLIALRPTEIEQWLLSHHSDLFAPPPETELTDRIDKLLDEARITQARVSQLLTDAIGLLVELKERNKHG